MSLLTVLHIAAGGIALCAGSISLASKKGHQWHRQGGKVFVLSMLLMSASSVYLALMKHELDNILVGSLTFYLVFTAWSAVDRKEHYKVWTTAGIFMVMGIAAISFSFAMQALETESGLKHGIGAGNFLGLCVIAFTFALFDVRFLIRRERGYNCRLVRHLWRMCLALFVAALSFFFGQEQLLPNIIVATYLNWLPIVSVLCIAIFWLARFAFFRGLAREF